MDALADKKAEIQKDVDGNRIMVYMKGNKQQPMCGFSAQVVQALLNLQADFETRDVLTDPELRQAIKEFSDWPTLPQLYVDGEFIGGCDIVVEMYQNGELKELVKAG